MLPYLTDAEVDEICAGLVQNAAKVRFLQALGLQVDRKPNGRPLVRRAQFEQAPSEEATGNGAGPKWSRPMP